MLSKKDVGRNMCKYGSTGTCKVNVRKFKKRGGKNRIKLKVRKALICVFKGRDKEKFFKISFVNVSI